MRVLRWMNVVHWVGDGIRYRIISASIILLGAMSIFCAAAFATAASYLWLATILPNYQAALCVAGGLTFAGGIIIAFAFIRHRRHYRGTESTPFPDLARQSEMVMDRAIHTAVSEMKDSPLSTLLTALALGAIVGLLRPKNPP